MINHNLGWCNSKYKFPGFETLRDLIIPWIRRLSGYWKRALVFVPRHLLYSPSFSELKLEAKWKPFCPWQYMNKVTFLTLDTLKNWLLKFCSNVLKRVFVWYCYCQIAVFWLSISSSPVISLSQFHECNKISNFLQKNPERKQTHWDRDKMAAISQTIFSSAFSWMKMFEL